MKVVSYNVHFGGKSNAPNPWRRLMEEFQPDVICAQETHKPQEYVLREDWATLRNPAWRRVKGRSWGSAVFAPRHELEEIPLDDFGGWVVGAKIASATIDGRATPLSIFCVHAPSPGPYLPKVRKILDSIRAKWDGSPLIIAGDFNITTARRHSSEQHRNSKGEITILERLEQDFKLRNAWQLLHPYKPLPQTLRWANKPHIPYHCDAIFVHESLIPHLPSAEVVASGFWSNASDHRPIVVDFN